MTNEAAERLRRDFAASVHDPYFAIEGPLLLDAALAAERRATVERIRAALDHPLTEDQNAIAVIRSVLDAEAAQEALDS